MSNTLISVLSELSGYLLFVSVIAILLVTTAWGIIKAARIKAAVHRHIIWLSTLFIIIAFPAICRFAPKLPLNILPAHDQFDIAAIKPPRTDSGTVQMGAGPSDIQFQTPANAMPVGNDHREGLIGISYRYMLLCLWAWVVGVLFMSARLLMGFFSIRRIVHTSEPVSCALQHTGNASKRLRLRVSPDIEGPLCFGLLRPEILLPKTIYMDGTPDEIRMVLSHELAHVERKDGWINLFQRVVEALFFFHPWLWYASSQLTQEREILCDQHVIEKGGSPAGYTRLLTQIVEQGLKKNRLHAVAMFEGRLLPRVRFLLDPKSKIQIKASRKAIAISALVVFVCLAAGGIRLKARSGSVDAAVTTSGADRSDEKAIRPQQVKNNLYSNYAFPTSNTGEYYIAERMDSVEQVIIRLKGVRSIPDQKPFRELSSEEWSFNISAHLLQITPTVDNEKQTVWFYGKQSVPWTWIFKSSIMSPSIRMIIGDRMAIRDEDFGLYDFDKKIQLLKPELCTDTTKYILTFMFAPSMGPSRELIMTGATIGNIDDNAAVQEFIGEPLRGYWNFAGKKFISEGAVYKEAPYIYRLPEAVSSCDIEVSLIKDGQGSITPESIVLENDTDYSYDENAGTIALKAPIPSAYRFDYIYVTGTPLKPFYF